MGTSTGKGFAFLRLLIDAVRGKEQHFTTGSIDRAIFLLAIPMILEMAMESLFAIVDVFYISRLHDNDALATVTLTESLLTLVYSLGIGLSMGATAMVARRVGEQQIAAARQASVQALYLGVGISVLISIFGVWFARDLLRLMGAGENVVTHHSGYTVWMLGGNATILLLFLINGIFRGAGDAALAMRTLILSNGLNILLDPIFIFGWGPIPACGVEGAAIATTLGRGLGVAYQLYHLFRGSGIIRFSRVEFPVQWDIMKNLVRVSAGGTGQFLIGSASWIFLVRIISTFGSVALAGYSIGIRIIIFAILPAWGLANAAATLVGQNLGAGEPERAEKSVWRTCFFNLLFMVVVTLVFYLFARPLVALFSADPIVIHHGVQCLQVICLGYIFYAYGMVVNQGFNGAGDTRTPTILSLFGFWVFQIPIAYLLSKPLAMGTMGVYLAIVLTESAMAIVAVLLFRKGTWKRAKI
jgi:putative MATE family efflux protein